LSLLHPPQAVKVPPWLESMCARYALRVRGFLENREMHAHSGFGYPAMYMRRAGPASHAHAPTLRSTDREIDHHFTG
jgi:hypothetical protein